MSIIIVAESPDALRLHVLEIASKSDIMAAIRLLEAQSARSVSGFNGTGVITNVTVRRPASTFWHCRRWSPRLIQICL
ncbi:AT-hook motif nuclear-localized protein 15 [Carex littledalei]|uniref:AT-hook motif nuclear-localized protein 15 n=1 Tax=Carex littledalei TaxID=544730 RepID=A0A833QPU1_9POAL|nr:AT-hook motif nuclear-localized protein 15 [Carex littledalei]